MHKLLARTVCLAVLGTAALALGACGASAKSSEVVFTLTGAELKGSTSVDSLAAPSTDPATLSAGYRYKKPGDADKSDPKKWEVSTYIWTPGYMAVKKGDTVKLRTFAVNGDNHVTKVIAPDGKDAVAEMAIQRGREAVLTFKATQTGKYLVLCKSHAPTMEAVVAVQ